MINALLLGGCADWQKQEQWQKFFHGAGKQVSSKYKIDFRKYSL